MSLCYSPASWYDGSEPPAFQEGLYYRLLVRANSSSYPDFGDCPYTSSSAARNYQVAKAPYAPTRKLDKTNTAYVIVAPYAGVLMGLAGQIVFPACVVPTFL